MIYKSFTLNGQWEMQYQQEKYTDIANPWNGGAEVERAVPGYWEDMTEQFLGAAFFRNLKINPSYGIQQYPIYDTAPDMALPNIIGTFFYCRRFECDSSFSNASIYFEGVQNSASVWINDVYLGNHEGYSTPFEFLVPDGVLREGTNTIVISVSNHRLHGYGDEPVVGLTSRAANECTGGITGNVELRVYNCTLRDTSLRVSEDCSAVSVTVEAIDKIEFSWSVCDGSKIIKSGKETGNFSFDTKDMELWSPENPKLYILELQCEGYLYRHRFGVRRLLTDGSRFKLNGVPYYLRGICEHCYFPETIHPNHDSNYYRTTIRKIKELGFNFIRFHTFVPEKEYMEAADELGMLIQVESPNNTLVSEWNQIVSFCRKYTSVVIYCCGNELLLDEPFIEHLHHCADIVHKDTDALFSPMSALRGVEYTWKDEEFDGKGTEEPFKHHPGRLNSLGKFSDCYNSYPNGQNSYFSFDSNPEMVDQWDCVYKKPRLSHEICIDGTYIDLSLKNRYNDSRVAKTDMFTSVERHLHSKGLLSKAPLYFKNSSEWQRRMRKYCFEATRRSNLLAGYDFLGPIDTHWHTFGYDVGMMNEFYELKPGESVRNVLMYNSPTVILTDLAKKTNFNSGEELMVGFYVSHYGLHDIENAELNIRLMINGQIVKYQRQEINKIQNGQVSKIYDFSCVLPVVDKPKAVKMYVTLENQNHFSENEWELYLFPKSTEQAEIKDKLIVSDGMTPEKMVSLLKNGNDILLIGSEPFSGLPTSFRIGLAGRTSGNYATVVYDHPVLKDLPHEGFCGWQFSSLLEGGKGVCFENMDVPFEPIIEVVSSHKYAIRQSALFEFKAFNGRVLVCSFNFSEHDPASVWLKSQLISYANADAFNPTVILDEQQLYKLMCGNKIEISKNTNLAFNMNDETAVRKKSFN